MNEFRLERAEAVKGGVQLHGVAKGKTVVRKITRREALLRASAASEMARKRNDYSEERDALLRQVEMLLVAADASRRMDGHGGYQSEAFKLLMVAARKGVK